VEPRWRQLHDLANRQHGQFTTRQAQDVGLTRPAVHYQLKAGLIARTERGVYRFTTFPSSAYEREATLILWSRLERGGALSHETTLSHFDLGDVFPTKYHLTVPKGFRRTPPLDVVLHRAALGPEDVHDEGILRYTTPARTILDLMGVDYPIEHLQLAVRQAVSRGLVRRRALRATSRTVRSLFEPLSPARRAELLERLEWLTEAA
jgi:predicted transcriptional regulator of viral defense system